MIKEVVIISDLRESSGGRFAATAHVEARFSCYFHVLFTSHPLQNSHVKAFCFRNMEKCSWKNQKRKKVVGEKKKKKKGNSSKKKERVLICQEKKKTSSVKVTSISGAPSWRPDFKQRSRFQTKIYHT